MEKQEDGEKENLLDTQSSTTCKLHPFFEAPDLKPDQGIATEASFEKYSNDLLVFGLAADGFSLLLESHKYTFESSQAETICLPSGVKEADIWFAPLFRPKDNTQFTLHTEKKKKIDLQRLNE